jgi:hypothetical protein
MIPINLFLAVKSAFSLIKVHPKYTINIALAFYLIDSLMMIPMYPYITKFSEIEDPNLMLDFFIQIFSRNQTMIYFLVFIFLSSLISLMLRIYYIKFSLINFDGAPLSPTLQTLKLSFYLVPVIFVANLIYILASFVGLMLLIVPGIILMLSFYFYEYFIVSKKTSFFEAFSESQRITQGYRLQLLGIIILFTIISFSLSSLIDSIFGNLMLTSFSLSSLVSSLTSLFYIVVMSHIFTQLNNKYQSEIKQKIDSFVE